MGNPARADNGWARQFYKPRAGGKRQNRFAQRTNQRLTRIEHAAHQHNIKLLVLKIELADNSIC